MGTRILTVASFLLCTMAAGFAQSDASTQQPNPAAPSGGTAVETPKDEKLVATPPLPSSKVAEFQEGVKDIHFDFDRAELRAEDREILSRDAEWLRTHPDIVVTLEGDADERGDIIYNLVLSGERATAARDALVEMGVPADRIAFATGWGKLYPVCLQSDESCWSQNRRAHFEAWPPPQEPARVASR